MEAYSRGLTPDQFEKNGICARPVVPEQLNRPAAYPPSADGQTPAGVFEHWCKHPGCLSWGGWGFARGRGKPVWFCFEHREDDERHL